MRTSARRTIEAVAVVLVVAAVIAPSAGAVTGQLRVLYVLATWGPRPFALADAQRVAEETDAFFRASSAGGFSMPGTVADWITLERNGVAPYSVLLDGTTVRALSPIAYTATLRAGQGLHRVGVAATDRAGNRGAVATVRLRLR